MIKCKKQFIAFFMAISIVFCVGSESYIKAEALEWAIPTITAAEAIKWLLGLLGVTVAGAAIADTDYEQLVENYNNYAEIQGQTAIETGKFWADIIDGTLDTGSQAWTNFKEWVKSLKFNYATDYNIKSAMESVLDTTLNVNDVYNIDYNFAFYQKVNNQVSYFYFFNLYDIGNDITLTPTSISIRNGWSSNKEYARFIVSYSSSTGLPYLSSSSLPTLSSPLTITFSTSNTAQVFLYGLTSVTSIANNFFDWELNKSKFNSYDWNLINNIGLIVSSAISDAIPDVIPLPWDQVSDTAEGINDKINELIEKVNEGVLSLEDYMIAIQSILGVIAFDTTTDLVIPTDPDLPDETIQDKINENVANNGFVLTGLENFFPFCIPFDIYAFITILVADPVAPVIHWEIYNPVTKENNEIVLDFAMWESVVILMRYIFDFLFIIGLALLARSLIGGDD